MNEKSVFDRMKSKQREEDSAAIRWCYSRVLCFGWRRGLPRRKDSVLLLVDGRGLSGWIMYVNFILFLFVRNKVLTPHSWT